MYLPNILPLFLLIIWPHHNQVFGVSVSKLNSKLDLIFSEASNREEELMDSLKHDPVGSLWTIIGETGQIGLKAHPDLVAGSDIEVQDSCAHQDGQSQRAFVIYMKDHQEDQENEKMKFGISCMEISSEGLALPLNIGKVENVPSLIENTVQFFQKFLPYDDSKLATPSTKKPSSRNIDLKIKGYDEDLKHAILNYIHDNSKMSEIESKEGFKVHDIVTVMINRYEIFLEEQNDFDLLYSHSLRQLKTSKEKARDDDEDSKDDIDDKEEQEGENEDKPKARIFGGGIDILGNALDKFIAEPFDIKHRNQIRTIPPYKPTIPPKSTTTTSEKFSEESNPENADPERGEDEGDHQVFKAQESQDPLVSDLTYKVKYETVLGILVAVIVVLFIIGTLYYIRRRRKRSEQFMITDSPTYSNNRSNIFEPSTEDPNVLRSADGGHLQIIVTPTPSARSTASSARNNPFATNGEETPRIPPPPSTPRSPNCPKTPNAPVKTD